MGIVVDFLEMLAGGLMNPDPLNESGGKLQVKPIQATRMDQLALPTLFAAMSKNASSPDAEPLYWALDRHADAKADEFDSFFGYLGTDDGANALNHVSSGRQQVVEVGSARNTGLTQARRQGFSLSWNRFCWSFSFSRRDAAMLAQTGFLDCCRRLTVRKTGS